MFNQYVWELYLNAGGNKVVKCFEDNLSKEYSAEYAPFIDDLRREYQLSEMIRADEMRQLLNLLEYFQDGNRTYNEDTSAEDAIDALYIILSENESLDAKETFSIFADTLTSISTILAAELPESFIPYYFKWNFNVLQIIADTFGFELPEIPKKADYEGRFYYYLDICNALQTFRKQNDLSPYELCAFLYDFAPKYIGGVSCYLISELPEPRSAFFIGGAKDDLFLSDSPDTITPWQCNPDTRAGDMIVMYLRAPVSAVDSVWRSCSVGFIDPFFYFYRCTYIGNPQKTQAVSLDCLRSDKTTGEMTIVRKNMQGINGVELKPSQYNRILQMGHSSALKLEYIPVGSKDEYSTEKEVEENIIKPLLKQLGYKEQDYVQQLYLEIGNHNHALIPDFVLLPEKHGNRQSAFAVVEAKRSITLQKDLAAALSQVRSYAKLLGVKYATIISQEKIWIFSVKDDFEHELFSLQISQIQADELNTIRRIIGNRMNT